MTPGDRTGRSEPTEPVALFWGGDATQPRLRAELDGDTDMPPLVFGVFKG